METIAAALRLTEGEPTEATILAEIERLHAAAEKVDAFRAAEMDRVVEQACADGRIDASQKDDFRYFYEQNAERTLRMFPIDSVKQRAAAIGGAEPTVELSEMDKIKARAKEIAEERGCDAAAAFSAARREMTTKDAAEA